MLPGEARVMAALRDHGAATVRQLEGPARMPKSGVRAALAALAGRGLVRRHRTEWALTAAGRAYAATTPGRAALEVPQSTDRASPQGRDAG
ncbi:hypothetical protein ACWEKT_30105 [Nocardia takedensis]